MATELHRLSHARSRWRHVLWVAMLAMAVCLGLLATVLRGEAGRPASVAMIVLFASTGVAGWSWWRHFSLLLSIRRRQRRDARD
jgi:hypothetical protein